MDIEQNKKNFLSLLLSSYKAGLTYANNGGVVIHIPGYFDNAKEVKIQERTLRKYRLSGRDFWDIICPAFKYEGVLESYADPALLSTSQIEHLNRYPQYTDGVKKVRELSESLISETLMLSYFGKERDEIVGEIKSKIVKEEGSLRKLKEWIDAEFWHIFVVNPEKLLSITNTKKNIANDDVEIIPKQFIVYGLHIAITKKQYPLLNILIKAGVKKDTNDIREYAPVKTKDLVRLCRSQSAFKSLLRKLRDRGRVNGSNVFSIETVQNTRPSYCLLIFKRERE